MVELIKRLERLEMLIISTQKEVLNIDELCILTGLSKSTIYKNTMNGTIPHFKKLKHLFFDRVEIIIWLKENRGYNADEAEKEAAAAVSMKGR